MDAYRSGTIIAAVKQDNFVVLAADRLCYDSANPGEGPPETFCKIATHPILPIAIAASGYANLAIGGRVIKTIGELLEDVGQDDLDFRSICNLLDEQLSSDVRVTRKRTKRMGIGEHSVGLVIAMAAIDGMVLGFLEIANESMSNVSNSYMGHPERLSEYYKYKLRDQRVLCGLQLPDSLSVAENIRQLVEDSIKAESVMFPDEPPKTGGPVDVVVVNSKRARFVPRANQSSQP